MTDRLGNFIKIESDTVNEYDHSNAINVLHILLLKGIMEKKINFRLLKQALSKTYVFNLAASVPTLGFPDFLSYQQHHTPQYKSATHSTTAVAVLDVK